MNCCVVLFLFVLIMTPTKTINACGPPVQTCNYFPEENGRRKSRDNVVYVHPDDLNINHAHNRERFGLNENDENELRVPTSLRVPTIESCHVKFPNNLTVYFFSTYNLDNAIILNLDSFDGTVPSEHFNPALPICMCIHGFRDDCLSCNQLLVDRILSQEEVNYFRLVWRVQRDTVPEMTKKFFALAFVQQIMEKYEEVSLDSVTLCGQSLTAHDLRSLGVQLIEQVAREHGLDPALALALAFV